MSWVDFEGVAQPSLESVEEHEGSFQLESDPERLKLEVEGILDGGSWESLKSAIENSAEAASTELGHERNELQSVLIRLIGALETLERAQEVSSSKRIGEIDVAEISARVASEVLETIKKDPQILEMIRQGADDPGRSIGYGLIVQAIAAALGLLV